MHKIITTTTTTISSPEQTHDFMKVDSFSQLPFIRPTPTSTTNTTSTTSASSLRLFGIDFSSSSTATDKYSISDDSNLETNNNNNNNSNSSSNNNNNNDKGDNEKSGRKFECHYCYRNFPTSQALGGHQNAHKLERQQAKRAHLNSTIMTTNPHHFLYYNPHHHHPTNSSYYPTTSLSNITHRYPYHSSPKTPTSFSHHYPPTINGSALATWRIPTAVHSHHDHHHHHATGFHRDRSLHPSLSLFDGPSSSVSIDNSIVPKSSNTSMNMNMLMNSSHQNQLRCGSGDHVSLDLHL